MILADEINRTPPKTQAALLEAMQEHQVTAGGTRHRLAEPFFVLATQNPIEQEGTYPLPEAQLDRFMFNILVDYPSEEEEFEIVRRTTADVEAQVDADAQRRADPGLAEDRPPRAGGRSRDPLRLGPGPPHAGRGAADAPDFIRDYVQWGAGPRASQYLVLGAKARAVLHGRFHASLRRRPGRGLSRAAAPHPHQLQRRGRRHQARRHHPPADRTTPAAATGRTECSRRADGEE